MRNLTVAVFGADGQLGADVVTEFLSAGLDVMPITVKDLDVERDDVYAFLSSQIKAKANVVINCVAYTNVDKAEDEPERAENVNSVFPEKLSKFCFENEIVLFHISTDYVFSGEKHALYTEKDIPCPINIYGKTKLRGEIAVLNSRAKAFIFRTSGLFGRNNPKGKKSNFVGTMLGLAKRSEPLYVVDDQFVSPTYTVDVAQALLYFVKNNVMNYGIYHCCSSGFCSWYQFAREIFSYMGMEVDLRPIPSEKFPTRAKRPQFSAMSNIKLSKYIKMPYWQQALKRYLHLLKDKI